MKKTALYQKHIDAGAKMVEFAGFEMPIRYTSVIDEHMVVRNAVGVFDVSHMGEFIIEGKEAVNWIERISSNDPRKLEIGAAQYSCMPNATGGIVDDLIIYKLEEEKYLLVVNGSNIEKDWEWINQFDNYEATLTNISEGMSLLAVQGPKATEALQALTTVDLSAIDYYHFTTGVMAGINNVIISATGYTGSGGFELYVSNEHATALWDAIFEQDLSFDIHPVGLGARDTLRLEMGYCLYGNDINDTTSPLEAGLGWITKFNHDFVNSTALATQKEKGIEKKLVGFAIDHKGIPRQDYEVLNLDGEQIGYVTSGTHSPNLDKGIGLAYIDVPFHKKEQAILIQIRKKQVAATVVKLPFIKT